MGWSNDQATNLDGLAVTYTNTTIEYSTGSTLTVDATATFAVNGDVDVAAGRQVNVGASGSTAPFAGNVALTSDPTISVRVVGDVASRLIVNGDGGLAWGAGVTFQDVNLYRSAANVLKTDNSLAAAVDIAVAGSSLPRGLVAYNRIVADSPLAGTTASTKATAASVITTTFASAKQGRIYQVVCPGLSVRMNTAARTGVFLTFTEDGTAPTTASAGMGEQYVNTPTAGSPVPVPISCLYVRAAASGPLKVALWIWNVSGGGATTANGTSGPNTTPIEIQIIDHGVDPGASA